MRTMKDSGIPWIGEIPENWSTTKIKHHFDIIAGATPKSEQPKYWDGQISWITPADYKTQDKYVSHGRKYLTKEGYDSCGTTIVPANSIIFSKRAPVGTVAITANELCTNQGCLSCVIRNNQDTDAVYYYYAMSSFTEQFELVSTGTTFKEIAADVFANFFLPRPPYSIQRNIAVFLDFECARIDAVMEQTRASIEEYKKLKQSVITQAVTKGIRPNRPMKDSGIDWIGQIPEEWLIRPLKGVTSRIIVGLATSVTQYYRDDGTPILRNLNIKEDFLADNDLLYLDNDWAENQVGKKIQSGDILTVHTGYIGISCIVPEKYNNALTFTTLISTPKREVIENRFLMWYINAARFYSQVFFNVETGAQNNLNTKAFVNLEVCVPSIMEQQEIVAFVDNEVGKLNDLISKKEAILTEMESYKKSLIFEYVTGKKEVL